MKTNMRILAVSVLMALAPLAQAQATGDDLDKHSRAFDSTAANRGQAEVAGKIAANFSTLAGSSDNALALVNALRNGTPVTLKAAPATPLPGTTPAATVPGPATTTTGTTITPPTGKMGWGNVKIALALAQDSLLRAGITKPTAAQLQTALTGGTVTKADGTSVAIKGVLQMRADGMGWGQIAKADGTKLGAVMSSLKTTHAQVAKLPPATTTAAAPASTGITTAAGPAPSTAHGKKASSGITTAASGMQSSTAGKNTASGITTATGASQAPVAHGKGGAGLTTAAGVASSSASKGLVTAEGAVATHSPKGNLGGRGVVTAAGGGNTNLAANHSAKGSTAGVVNASGADAAAISTAQGGNARSSNHGNGKGKGG